jgi:putative ABC transport system substrate-binding protein
MDRREFLMLSSSAVGTTIMQSAAGARQASMPAVGFLRNTDAESSRSLVSAFHRGLAESGYAEGQNLRVEYRWASNHDQELPALAADLVKRDVAVIVAGGGSVVALAAKAATQTIPIVFELGGDPVKMGLVDSLNRPGSNLTGVALFSNVIGPKRVEILRDLAPSAKPIGLLVNPENPNTELEIRLARDAATSLGVQLDVVNARNKHDIDTAFAELRRSSAGGLIVMATPLFVANREYLVSLAARDALPAIYPFPSFAKAGGLMSYGDDLSDAFRQVGIYTGRILKGEKPSDLPIVQPSKFELVINLKTAKALGLNVPAKMLALADEVIE